MAELYASLDDRVAARLDRLSPAEQRVVRMFQENREEVLFASAAALAAKAGTSDATVVRATKALGFDGMEALRRALAAELKRTLSPASRLAETLREVGGDLRAALDVTLNSHLEAIENLRRDITPDKFRQAVDLVGGARRIVVFGIGPSSAMANYFAIQLGRFGLEATSSTHTGLLSADDLRKLRSGDCLVVLAYSRVYPELSVLIEEADRLRLRKMLLTDTLGALLRDRFDLILPVARGRAEMLSMHTATLALIEALLVGIASARPAATLQSLKSLNGLRERLVGRPMNLATPTRDPGL